MNLAIIIRALKCASPIFLIVLAVSFVMLFLLRKVGNLDYPLNGEFFTSPFYSEVVSRYLDVWDDHFGLGFSNLLNTLGGSPHEGEFSGAYNLVSDSLSAAFQYVGNSFFLNQVVSLFLLALGVYWIFKYFRFFSQNALIAVLVSIAITIIIQSSDMIIGSSASGGRFLAGQGLMLIAFLQIRRLFQLPSGAIYSFDRLIPLAIGLSTLLLVLNQFFLSLALMVGFQGVIEYISRNNRREILANYTKILAIFCGLIVVIFGHVILPSFLSSSASLIAGGVGRHDSPLAQSIDTLLRFYNDPSHDKFGLFGTWLQSGLAMLGIIWALFSPQMRRWAIIDILLIILFVFLAKGSAPPFPEVNHWLHVNIPFLRIMGSSYPYDGVIYTLLIFYLIYGIGSLLSAMASKLPRRIGRQVAFAVLLGILTISIFRNGDYLSGDLGGRVAAIQYPAEYYEFKRIAEQDMKIGRAYYFPDEDAQIGRDYQFSPAPPMGCCFDLPFSSTFRININWSNYNKISGYYGQTMAFLMHHLQSGDEIARIFSGADTKYAVFDMSLKQTSTANERLLALRDQVRASQSFEFKPALSNRFLEVYENKQWQPSKPEIHSLTLASDDPNIFLEAAKKQVNLSQNPMVVSGAISLSEVKELKANNILNRAVLYNSDVQGMMLDMTHTMHEIKPDSNNLGIDAQTWYTDNPTYQMQEVEKYGGRFLGRYPIASISSGGMANFIAKTLPNIKYKLVIRALVAPGSGRIEVSINNAEKKLLDLHSSEYTGFQWFDLGDVYSLKGQVVIKIASLDAGRAKIIDVVSIIPETQLSDSMETMNALFKDIQVDWLKTSDYLRWKNAYEAGNSSATSFLDNNQLKPKKLLISHHHFKLHDDFDGDAEEANFNLNSQRYVENDFLDRSNKEKNFLRAYNGISYRFVASADTGAGTYSLKYELVACQPISELSLNLTTANVSETSPLTIYASNDAITWIKQGTRTSDAEGNKPLDLSSFSRGKKKVFVKISYQKLKEAPASIYLLDLAIRGIAGKDNLNCEYTGMVKSNSENQLPYSTSIDGLNFHSAPDILFTKRNNFKTVNVINKAFDPNWRLDGMRPFNINYGFAAFSVSGLEQFHELKHDWQNKYRLLILISFGFYIFLWGALIWISCRRNRHCGLHNAAN